MNGMFQGSEFHGDLSKWDVSKVTDMGWMFDSSYFNGDLSNWDVSKVTDMNSMFEYSGFNGDLSKWDVSQVTLMNEMFTGDSCSLCDHVPQGFERACRSQCVPPSPPSPLDCAKALSENQCR